MIPFFAVFFLFFLCLDVLRFQHAPSRFLCALLVSDLAMIVYYSVLEVKLAWQLLRILSFLDMMLDFLEGAKMYLRNL